MVSTIILIVVSNILRLSEGGGSSFCQGREKVSLTVVAEEDLKGERSKWEKIKLSIPIFNLDHLEKYT
ncbi:hypothetical protein CHS0354_008094 [Potamilus streckersoni]|uniref:Uncharacterized protein n=1 Tax=Potamilus streckersoni TaxID=2493646 RepID=A0AAE0T0H6_9BIVA|nr:hypothetical protein CHS0354_008094 [Potamilus streckersoni]